jgi:MoxR-like ATPase
MRFRKNARRTSFRRAYSVVKTPALRSLLFAIQDDCKRIWVTSDLLPTDIVGTLIYNSQSDDFFVKKDPVFASIIFADKNQSHSL